MKLLPSLIMSTAIATPVMAEEVRQLDAHLHGTGELNIAVEGQQIAMEFHAPGADIVGFEYVAESAEDKAAIDAGVATLESPLDLFVLPDAAGCSVIEASASLESEADDDHDQDEDHEEHDHDEEHDEEHAHDDEHDHEEEHDHDEEHAHEDEHDHDEDHAHDDGKDHAGHTEFHAEYLLECTDPSAVTDITFAYFAAFPNALEVEVQIISTSGATAREVTREAPTLDVSDIF